MNEKIEGKRDRDRETYLYGSHRNFEKFRFGDISNKFWARKKQSKIWREKIQRKRKIDNKERQRI